MDAFRRKIYAWAAAAAALAMLAGCKEIAGRKAIKDCKFELADVAVKDITLSDVNLLVKVSVYNPNDGEVIVDRFQYKLWSDKNPIAEGEHRTQERIAPGVTKELALTMKSPLKNLGKGILNQLTNRGNVTYTLQGTVFIKTFVGELQLPLELRKKY